MIIMNMRQINQGARTCKGWFGATPAILLLAQRLATRTIALSGIAIIWLLAAGILNAQSSSAVLDFQVSSETVPAGSKAQIKLVLVKPQPISSGYVFFTFKRRDSTSVNPSIEAATVFSAAGDAAAIGAVMSFATSGFSVSFSSPSAGIGRMASLPVLEFSIPVTEDFSVDVYLARSFFAGPGGIYKATVRPGSVTVGGALSIQTVTPAGSTGMLLAGSVLRIEGTGFSTGTAVELDGVSLASVHVVSPSLINVTLNAATEIIGKHIRLRNTNGAQLDYWVGLGSSFYTFPLNKTSAAVCSKEPGFPGYADPLHLVLQNPNPAEAQITVTNIVSLSNPRPATISTRIPSGEMYTANISDPPKSAFQTSSFTPIRALCFARTRNPDFQLLAWITVIAQAQPIPSFGWVANAASQKQAGVSPGEIISIHGVAGGPPAPARFALDDSGRVPDNLNGMRVLFDGIPSPLLYASGAQVNAVVPYQIARSSVTTLQLEYNGVPSAEWGIPVVSAAPGIFTINSSGEGQGAVLNQDNSLNGPTNPALRGSVIQIFATGEGLTLPDGVTGAIAANIPSVPALPVSVMIGGIDAPVLWAGSSPGSIAGLLQVNALVPAAVPAGDTVLILLKVGSAAISPAGPTIAVK